MVSAPGGRASRPTSCLADFVVDAARCNRCGGAYGGMERDRILRFTPVDHPDARVQRVGFDLTHPYVEQCWSAVAGPSSTLFLRRMPTLWREQVPAVVEASDLSRSLGLGVNVGDNSRFANMLGRLVQFRLGRLDPDGAGFDVYRQVGPLSPRQLDRVPRWTRDAHERIFGEHLSRVAEAAGHSANVASLTARLDRLQHGPARPSNGASAPGQAVGR